MNLEISSERLLLRPIRLADVTALHRLWTDEHVRRFLWDGKVVPFEQTAAIVERNETLFQESGFGIWGVRQHNDSELIGFAGYWHFHAPPRLELLFGVGADYWDRGIATEAGNCVIRYAFETLRLNTIEASTDVDNVASIRVLEKLGLSLSRHDVLEGLDTVFYSLQRNF